MDIGHSHFFEVWLRRWLQATDGMGGDTLLRVRRGEGVSAKFVSGMIGKKYCT